MTINNSIANTAYNKTTATIEPPGGSFLNEYSSRPLTPDAP